MWQVSSEEVQVGSLKEAGLTAFSICPGSLARNAYSSAFTFSFPMALHGVHSKWVEQNRDERKDLRLKESL